MTACTGVSSNLHLQDAAGNTHLHHAVAGTEDLPELVAALIAVGLPVDAVNTDGDTALHVAARTGHVEACRALVAGAANVVHRNNKNRIPGKQLKVRGVQQWVPRSFLGIRYVAKLCWCCLLRYSVKYCFLYSSSLAPEQLVLTHMCQHAAQAQPVQQFLDRLNAVQVYEASALVNRVQLCNTRQAWAGCWSVHDNAAADLIRALSQVNLSMLCALLVATKVWQHAWC